MPLTVFYSWQTDRPSNVTRSFIQSALDAAIRELNRELTLIEAARDEELSLDRDTQGVSGSPPIVDTILQKIAAASVFVPDLTYVALTDDGRALSNPNVLIEYGWALKTCGHSKIVAVMNTAFGDPANHLLPFDLRHLRHPITYHLGADADSGLRSSTRTTLIAELKSAIRQVVEVCPRRRDDPPYEGAATTVDPASFYQPEDQFIVSDPFGRSPTVLRMPTGPKLFLRVIPESPLSAAHSAHEAQKLLREARALPMGTAEVASAQFGRSVHGGFCASIYNGALDAITQLFPSGEIWGVDFSTLDPESLPAIPEAPSGYFPSTLLERVFVDTLDRYLRLAANFLHLPLPLRVVAGAAGIRGFRMTLRERMTRFGRHFADPALSDNILWTEAADRYDLDVGAFLGPLFEKFWHECGMEYPGRA